ncbi:MAG: RES family NAD+ phosphorylase [Deltaproteobacteria bacterium]|nr:RES family NAD+ phosphorylase [Deltaproteobacteria bacterium]
MKEPVKLTSYQGNVFRNIAGLDPSLELTNDIAPSQTAQEVLKKFYYDDPQMVAVQSPIERILQRSICQMIQEEISKKFKPGNWYASRFSNGSWGVLYTAESEVTALKEALYHAKNHFYKEELERNGFLEITRRVIHLYAQSKYCGDLIRHKVLNHRKLVSKDSSGYPYCQKLAEHFHSKGAQILRAPSARDEKGFGVPIFNKEAIQKDFGHLKYVKCELKKNSVKVFPEGETYKLD